MIFEVVPHLAAWPADPHQAPGAALTHAVDQQPASQGHKHPDVARVS
jgi:hypothetical protein